MTGPLDAGLQAERTRLAWSRTALSVAGNGILLLHLGHYPAGLAVVGLALCFQFCGTHRYRLVYRAVRSGRSVTEDRLLRWTGVLAVLPGLLVLASVILG